VGKIDLGEDQTNLENLTENSLKILLGLALVNQLQDLFVEVTEILGGRLHPFSGEFAQARRHYNRSVRCLFELTLKAMIVCCEFE